VVTGGITLRSGRLAKSDPGSRGISPAIDQASDPGS